MNNSIIWIIIILLLLGGNSCNGLNGIFGGCGGNSCGNDCTWIIILVLLFCCGNNGLNICDNQC